MQWIQVKQCLNPEMALSSKCFHYVSQLNCLKSFNVLLLSVYLYFQVHPTIHLS